MRVNFNMKKGASSKYRPIIVWLYNFAPRGVRWFLRQVITRVEGGPMYSETIRQIYHTHYGITIGKYSHGGCFDLGRIPRGTTVGRYGSFAQFRIFSRNHPLESVSTHPYFFNSALGYLANDRVDHRQLTIGHDVWIGHGAIILPSVSSIGNGAVIGALAVVTKDVPPFAVVAGNPAKIIKHRFTPEVIEKIESEAWWFYDINEAWSIVEKLQAAIDSEK